MSKVYLTPEQTIRQRYNWFLEAQSLGNVSLACKRLGISRKPSTNGNNDLRELITTALSPWIVHTAPITVLDLLNKVSADVSLNSDEKPASAPCGSFNSSKIMA